MSGSGRAIDARDAAATIFGTRSVRRRPSSRIIAQKEREKRIARQMLGVGFLVFFGLSGRSPPVENQMPPGQVEPQFVALPYRIAPTVRTHIGHSRTDGPEKVIGLFEPKP